jgi:predicted methyltransferase
MTTQTAQYDHIGSKYDENAHTAMLKRAESYTVLRMVGPLAGKRVLDLAYGFGFYTRLLKQHGAAQVISIHISPEAACAAAPTTTWCPAGASSPTRSTRRIPSASRTAPNTGAISCA